MGERLEQASAKLEGESIGDPLAVARLQATPGTSLLSLGYPKKAIDLLTKCLATFSSISGPDHPSTLASMDNLAIAYSHGGQNDQSLQLLEQALTLRKAKLGPDHPDTFGPRSSLVMMFEEAGQFDRALLLQREMVAIQKRREGSESLPYSAALSWLSTSLMSQKKWSEAEPVLRECLAIREAKEPDNWKTFNTKSKLGGALLGQKKYHEARPLLVAGYEGMKHRADKISPAAKIWPGEALERLIELAEATGQPDEAKAWRAEKARITTPPASAAPPVATPNTPTVEVGKPGAGKP